MVTSKKPVSPAVTPAAPAQAATPATSAPAAAPKVVASKYAPLAVVTPNATITMVQSANPKKPGSDSAARWSKYMRTGITVAELGAQYKANNLPANWATLDVRWALQRGHIALGTPVKAETAKAE
jgi:hypothetical protein